MHRSLRRPHPFLPRPRAWKLPALVARALALRLAGASRDVAAVSVLRADAKRELFRLRLPARDRRHAEVVRLMHAVRLRSF